MKSVELANVVRFHRKKSRLSQPELARLAGVGKSSVFDLEKGKKTIQLDTLIKILKVLNVEMSFESPMMSRYRSEMEKADNDA